METKNYMITKERFFEIKEKFKETLLSKQNRKGQVQVETFYSLTPKRIRFEHFIVYNILRDKPLSTGIKDVKSENVVRTFKFVKEKITKSADSSYSKRYADYYFEPFGLTDDEVEVVRDRIKEMEI